MTLVNHLKDVSGQDIFIEVAYGKHVVTGDLCKSFITGASPTHVITLQHLLGRGPWDGCEGLWWNGLEVKPDKYKFYPGIQTPNPVFKTFTADSATDVLTSTAHGFANGDIVIHAHGDLPVPLAAGRLYYVRDQTANTYKLALTSGGTAINLTTNGTGVLQVYKNDAVQGFDPVFSTDTPHSGVAWIRAELAAGLGEFDTAATPPTGLRGIFRTTKCQDYDATGDPVGATAYSTNPALQIADLIIRYGRRPTSRIDWPAWVAWRDFMAATISYDYTTLAGGEFDGFGLTATLYNDTTFTTPISQRIDPVILFPLGSGSPGVGINVDNFGVRWEGKIKFNFTQTYTFTVVHDDSVKLWVDNLTTPIMDQPALGTHTATFAATAGVFYDIKIEWTDSGGGNAEFRIDWQAPGLPKEMLPHRALYPKTVNRPRYETHPFFSSPTRLDDAVRRILAVCNSTMQEVDGKLRFFCLEQITETSFHFTNDKIVNGSLRLIPRDVLNLRNSWQAAFRDVDSQYLEPPLDPVLIERPDLIDAAGRRIDGEAIDLFNTTPHQAYRTLEGIVKRSVDSKYTVELTGTADTFPVLPGDAVAVDVEFLDWNAKQMLVTESTDASSEETADERQFIMREWTGQSLALPSDISGLVQWYDANQLTGLSDNDPISTCTDFSGNGFDATQTGSARPLYRTNIINGKPAMQFDGVDDYLITPSSGLETATEVEMFCVFKLDADPPPSGATGGFHSNFGTSSTLFPHTDGVIHDAFFCNSRHATVNPTDSLAAWGVYNVVSTASEWTSFHNFAQIFTTASNTVFAAAANRIIGQSIAVGSFLSGYIAEWIIYDHKLSAADKADVEGYIAAKYGLTL